MTYLPVMSALIPPSILLAVGVVTSQADPVTSFNLNITSANGGSNTLFSWSYTGTPTIGFPEGGGGDVSGIAFFMAPVNIPEIGTLATGSDLNGYTGGPVLTGLGSTGLVLTNTTTLATTELSYFALTQLGEISYFTFASNADPLDIFPGQVAVLSGPTSGAFFSGVPFSSFNAGQWSTNIFGYSNFSTGLTISGSPIPEPSTYGLVLGGLALVGAAMRRRKKA